MQFWLLKNQHQLRTLVEYFFPKSHNGSLGFHIGAVIAVYASSKLIYLSIETSSGAQCNTTRPTPWALYLNIAANGFMSYGIAPHSGQIISKNKVTVVLKAGRFDNTDSAVIISR